MSKKLDQSNFILWSAIIGVVGVIIGAALGYFGAIANANAQIQVAQENANAQITAVGIQVYGPINVTQTAEAEARSTERAQLITPILTAAPKTPGESRVYVFSKPYPFENTNIHVEQGERIEITVLGDNPTWNCGRTDSIGPEGYPNQLFADTVYDQASACALIGSISAASPDMYFPVGAHTIIEKAPQSGTLYLGCNDSKGRFDDNPPDSKLEVKVTVGN